MRREHRKKLTAAELKALGGVSRDLSHHEIPTPQPKQHRPGPTTPALGARLGQDGTLYNTSEMTPIPPAVPLPPGPGPCGESGG